MSALYFLFNEGYYASKGERLTRNELCSEAIRLTRALAKHPEGNTPETNALLSLMHFLAARLPTRIDEFGAIVLLADQPEDMWDKEHIRLGFFHLAKSAAGKAISEYHLQAGIAAQQNQSPPDWHKILQLYDDLVAKNNSPVIHLNRAVVVAKLEGPEKGLAELEPIRNHKQMKNYHFFYAIEGSFYRDLNRIEMAKASYKKALEFCNLDVEREFLRSRIRNISSLTLSKP